MIRKKQTFQLNIYGNCLFILICIFFFSVNINAQKPIEIPVFKIDFKGDDYLETPTADKPQSKLFFMDDMWWAVLPSVTGPQLWNRNNNGKWKEITEVGESLKGLPGRADIWYEDRTAVGVGVSSSSMIIFKLLPLYERGKDGHWKAEFMSRLPLPYLNPRIETATIVKDKNGVWWVAADVEENKIVVWWSLDLKDWNTPITLGEDVSPDDICCISTIDNGVLVIWSNQRAEAVYAKEHENGDSPEKWSGTITIDSGNRTADDHINLTQSINGAVWVATKNSVDEIGVPNFVLRIRTQEGEWKNLPYVKLIQNSMPSRPVVCSVEDSNIVFSGYTFYNFKEKDDNRILFGIVDTTKTAILKDQKEVIHPLSSLKSNINNITKSKKAFPKYGPWIILASDKEGNVYEADLKYFFAPN